MKRRSAPPDRRPRRVAEQVRQVVTQFLQEEARDPRIGLVTVTGVEITSDLHYATVRYVVHGGADEQVATQYGLGKATAAIRVASRLYGTRPEREIGDRVHSSEQNARNAKGHAYTPQNVLATLYHVLGIDPLTTLPDHQGRPMYLLDDRERVAELG